MNHNLSEVIPMKYKVVLYESEEGYAVSCPALPGCWSQGASESEALENIQDAIHEYLAAIEEMTQDALVREVEVV
jgi:predicted RNase H-like HicB family nuclease